LYSLHTDIVEIIKWETKSITHLALPSFESSTAFNGQFLSGRLSIWNHTKKWDEWSKSFNL